MSRMFPAIALLACLLSNGVAQAESPTEKLPANTWVPAKIDFSATLKKAVPDGNWSTSDGYSDSVYRSKTGTVLIRTGIASKALGTSPGFYTNTTVEWNLKDDTARVVEIAKWGGGSYGGGKLLAGFAESPTPTPRHTYDGICYVPDQDAMWIILGANWRTTAKNSDEEAVAQHKKDNRSTWQLDLKTALWTRHDSHVSEFYKSGLSPYEAHLTWWPRGNALLFFNDNGDKYAEFDLKTNKWKQAKTANPCPMSLYHARSTWDSKRNLWVFRNGLALCTFDPEKKEFARLPDCAPPTGKDDTGDRKGIATNEGFHPRAKGICYIDKHDVYLVTGNSGNDTRVYDCKTGQWSSLAAGEEKLPNGYCHYDPATDSVVLNYQLQCFRLRYVPAKK